MPPALVQSTNVIGKLIWDCTSYLILSWGSEADCEARILEGFKISIFDSLSMNNESLPYTAVTESITENHITES